MSNKVLFTSNLRFRNAEREADFMLHVQHRHNAIRKEQGWDNPGVYTGWLLKRQNWESEFLNCFDHRASDPRFGELYRQFGCSDNLPKRAIGVYHARTCEQLLNTEPWCSFMPEGPEDEHNPIPPPPQPIEVAPGVFAPPIPQPTPPDPIRQGERYWQRKLMDGKARYRLREAVQQAGYIGESVLKISKALTPVGTERDKAKIWLDQPEGNPLQDQAGRLIYEDDEWEPSTEVVGEEMLKRDPLTVKPPTAVLSDTPFPIKDRPPERALRIEALNWADFVCSTTAADIHTTDYIAHTYDKDLDELLNLTYGLRMSKEAKAWLDLQKAGQASVTNGSESGQPKTVLGEAEAASTATDGQHATGKLHLVESYLRYDVLGRGKTDEVYVLWNIEDNHPIYYDFLEEVSPTGKRPFDVVRPIPIKDRWYGMSFYELLSNEHQFVDLQKTRLNHRSSRNSVVKFLREGSIAEVDAGWKFDIDLPHVWNEKPSGTQDKGPPLRYVELPQTDAQIWQLLEHERQQAKLASGTITAADAAASDLNESKTLGQSQMLNSESELMSGNIIQDVLDGITSALKQSVVCCFQDFTVEEFKAAMEADAREILGSVNGDVLIKWLEEHKPKKLLNFVRLLMSKQRSKEQMQANLQAKELLVGETTWLELEGMGPHVSERFKPLYAGILTSLDVPNVDQMLKTPPLPPPPPPSGPMGAPPPMPGQVKAPTAPKGPPLATPNQAAA